MKRLSKTHGLNPIEAAALDCVEESGHAVDEVQKSIDELGHVARGSNFWVQMSDIQTWVSAALTDEDTCMDAFDEHHMSGRVESLGPRYIVNVAHLTSNALALINSYASVSNEAVDSVWFSGKWLCPFSNYSTLFPPTEANTDYIKTSCKVAMYPRLCYNSLSISAGKIQTNPKQLVHTSLNVTLAFTQATSVTMKSLNHNASAALVDCAEELGDTVEMLQQSIEELGRVDGASSSRFQLSNIQTWVSAAFTNEDTCEDGFANLPLNGKVETTAHRHVTKAAHLTSNALALVNAYASAKTASP
ncbi:hypothetical protein DVH24_001374 [Malus domestica]|uniref:pectinesterase n=1 Tax=Malus domestica TaxID=3750 RepID=A0A498JZ18_MALDO|nr:hypothetical protein DVH24_001374 [Malus domestica]